jgi:pyruvate/2-oxoglutarate dehydrogenase complex dihydrolipoamide acyltransferase (E2) component
MNNNTTITAANATARATPAVRALADQLDVRLARVTGTGAGGRITTADVRRYAAAPDDAWFPGSPGPAAA